MSEFEIVYRVPNPRAACLAVREMDGFYRESLVGLAVIAKGYAEREEEFYVFANLDSPSADDRKTVEAILGTHGSQAGHTLDGLLRGTPKPHLVASGSGTQILATLRSQYPGCDPVPA